MIQAIKRLILIVTSLFFALLTFSCISTKTLTIEIPKPAAKNLPENIQSLIIVNRTVDEKYQNYNIDSLQDIFYRNQFELDTAIYDLQAVDTMLKAIGELVFESGRYDFVIPADRFIEFKKDALPNYEMPWDEVKDLCERFDADAVLSVDYYKAQVRTNIDQESYYTATANGFRNMIFAQIQVNYEVLFRIYDTKDEKIILSEFQRDSLFWEDIDITTRNLFSRLLPVKQALTETSIAVALDLSEKISTNWYKEQRNIFMKGKSEFEKPGNMALNGEWLQAIELWKQISESSKSKAVKSKAEFNAAVGYEILGDLDQSISWALKSYNTMFRPLTYEYLEKLQKRKNELKSQ